jgi:hypothetical protein
MCLLWEYGVEEMMFLLMLMTLMGAWIARVECGGGHGSLFCGCTLEMILHGRCQGIRLHVFSVVVVHQLLFMCVVRAWGEVTKVARIT